MGISSPAFEIQSEGIGTTVQEFCLSPTAEFVVFCVCVDDFHLFDNTNRLSGRKKGTRIVCTKVATVH